MPYRRAPEKTQPAEEKRRRERDPGGGRGENSLPKLVGAGVRWRALAATIDTVVVFGPPIGAYFLLNNILYKGSCAKVTGFYGETSLIDCSPAAKAGTFIIPILLCVGLAFLVEVSPTAGGRQSLGRRLVGARAVDRFTGGSLGVPKAAGRFAFRSFISTLFGIGFLWMIWDREDRTLHDIVCRSAVTDGPRWSPRRRRRRSRTSFFPPS
jgi:uncharacterized RDD family membrane protein YckC